MRFRALAPAVVAVTVLLAAGCTSTSGTASGGSSPTSAGTASAAAKAAACKVLNSKLDDITSSLSSTTQTIVSDPKQGVVLVKKISSTVAGTIDEISDPQAHTLVQKTADDLTALSDALGTAVDHPLTGAPAVQKAASAVQKDVQAIATYCS